MDGRQYALNPRIQDLLTVARFHRQARKASKTMLLIWLFLPGGILALILGRSSFRISRALLSGNRLLLSPFYSHTPLKLAYVDQHIALHTAIRYEVENSYAEEQVAFWRAVTRLDEFTNNPYIRFTLGCSSGKLFVRLAQKEFPRDIAALQHGNRKLCEPAGATPLQCDLRLAGTLMMSDGCAQSGSTKRYQQLHALGWWLGIRALRRYLDEIAEHRDIGDPGHAVMFLWHRMLRYIVSKRTVRRNLVQSLEIEPPTEARGSIVHALAKAENEFLEVAKQNGLPPEEIADALRKIHQVTLAPVWLDYFAHHVEAKRWRRKRKQSAQ